MIRQALFNRLYFHGWKTSGLALAVKRRRYRLMIEALGIRAPARILEVGCGIGADFSRFAVEDGHDVHGVDLITQTMLCQMRFTQCDARQMPFADRYFDAVVSVGVLEHIEPITSLCEVTAEMARVSKRQCHVVPSIGSPIEPHVQSPFWSARDSNRKRKAPLPVNGYSDEAWRQFPGFIGSATTRYWYLPGIQQLLIHMR